MAHDCKIRTRLLALPAVRRRLREKDDIVV